MGKNSIKCSFKVLVIAILTTVLFLQRSYAAETTIEGKIIEVVPSKKEIYLLSAGEKYEYYFKPDTKIVKSDAELPFNELKEGMKVKVTANKVGKRLDPITVEIVE